jgi:hypothetical protein
MDTRTITKVLQLVTQVHPDSIVLTAAYTEVDGSEQNSKLAFAAIGAGTNNAACVAHAKCRLLSLVRIAREVLRQVGRNSIRVLPITTAQAGRPAYSLLSPVSLYAHGHDVA